MTDITPLTEPVQSTKRLFFYQLREDRTVTPQRKLGKDTYDRCELGPVTSTVVFKGNDGELYEFQLTKQFLRVMEVLLRHQNDPKVTVEYKNLVEGMLSRP